MSHQGVIMSNQADYAGLKDFHRLLNLSSLDEINMVFACVLYKGHGKQKTSDSSYRTISTCTVI